MDLARIAKHLLTTARTIKRRLSGDDLAAIDEAIAAVRPRLAGRSACRGTKDEQM